VTAFEYDPNQNLVKIIKPQGNTIESTSTNVTAAIVWRAASPMRDGHESSFFFASFVFFGGHFSFAGLKNSGPTR
jgi:hypothetical protein